MEVEYGILSPTDPSPRQEASVFFKKRAVLEEEYGKSLQKLARTTSEVYSMNDGKAGYCTTHSDRTHGTHAGAC